MKEEGGQQGDIYWWSFAPWWKNDQEGGTKTQTQTQTDLSSLFFVDFPTLLSWTKEVTKEEARTIQIDTNEWRKRTKKKKRVSSNGGLWISWRSPPAPSFSAIQQQHQERKRTWREEKVTVNRRGKGKLLQKEEEGQELGRARAWFVPRKHGPLRSSGHTTRQSDRITDDGRDWTCFAETVDRKAIRTRKSATMKTKENKREKITFATKLSTILSKPKTLNFIVTNL